MSENRTDAEVLDELQQELAAHRAMLASLATQMIFSADNKHSMLEQVFTEAIDVVDRTYPHADQHREAVIGKVHELADLVQHGE